MEKTNGNYYHIIGDVGNMTVILGSYWDRVWGY